MWVLRDPVEAAAVCSQVFPGHRMCLMGPEGSALCWPGTQELRMGSGIPKEEEGRLQTVYKETCVVLFLPVRIKTLAREHLALRII